MAILYGFLARCLFGVVFLYKADDRVGSLDSQISPASKNRAPIQHEILKARSVSYLFPSSWVLRCVFWWCKQFLVLNNLTCAQEPR